MRISTNSDKQFKLSLLGAWTVLTIICAGLVAVSIWTSNTSTSAKYGYSAVLVFGWALANILPRLDS